MTTDVLDNNQKAAVRRLMPLILGLGPAEAPSVNIAVERLDDFLSALPGTRDTKKVTDILFALDVMSVVLHPFERVSDLEDDELRAFYEKLYDTDKKWPKNVLDQLNLLFPDLPTVRDIAKALREILCLAYYSQPGTNGHTGYTPLWDRPQFQAVDPTLANDPGYTKDQRTRLDVDAIREKRAEGRSTPLSQIFKNDGRPKIAVIGSGPGGSVIASRLALRYDVAVFEQGPRFWDPKFPLDPMASMALLYDHGLMTPTKNLDVRLLRARVVGGGSVVNIGLSVPILDATLARWIAGGVGFNDSDLRDAFEEVKKVQRFGEFNPATFTDAAHRWKQGLDAMGGMTVHPVLSDVATRAIQHDPVRPDPHVKGDRCLGAGMCNYGCRFAQHRTVDRTFLRDAENRGAKIHPNTRIVELIPAWDPVKKKQRIAKLRIRRGGDDEIIAVDHVVLAGGAVGSPALLLASGDRHPVLKNLPGWRRVGKGFGMNYGTPAVACWKEPMSKPGWNGLQVSYRVDKPGTGDKWMLEGGFLPPGVLAAVVPGVGADHRRMMGAYSRLAMAVNTIASPQTGRVTASGDVEYTVDDKQMAVIHDTLAYVVDSYLHGGAEVVRIAGVRGLDDTTKGSFGPAMKGQHAKIAAQLRRMAPTADRLALASGHPQGGMRMNVSPEKGAVGADFRVHGTSNLWVADASLFPSTIAVNLQWTIMALAWLAGETMHAKIQAG